MKKILKKHERMGAIQSKERGKEGSDEVCP